MEKGIKQKKLKIGIDIDDVLVDTIPSFISFHNKVYGTNFGVRDIKFFDLEKTFGGTREDIIKKFYEFEKTPFFDDIRIMEGAVEHVGVLGRLYELFAITSRHERLLDKTVNLIDNNFKNKFSKILFTNQFSIEGSSRLKSQICKKLEIPILIEDRRKYALECAEEGIKVLLMDKPWNRENCEHENIIRVKDWKEIIERIEGIKKELERKNIVEEIKKFVEEECKKNNLGEEILINHIIPVVDYSKKLAEEKNADVEIVEISAWLHDIGSIICGRENHHLTGAEIAEKKLKELNYPNEKIKKVKKCILNHRGSVGNNCESTEEKVIVDADVLACFGHLEGQFLWVIEGDGIKNQQEIRKIVRQKFINKFNQLSPEGKELVRSKYEAVMLLLGD